MKKVWHTPVEVAPAEAVSSGPSKLRTELEEAKPVYIGHEVDYLYDGQMPVWGQEYEDDVLQQTRVNFLGARGIEAVVAIDHTRGNQVALQWLLYDGHGNLVRTMAPDYTLSGFQWRGVWGEVQGSLGTGRGYCANLGHPEDETGLVYMRARYYEPATGRFISEDPARDGMNWYLYADGNPVGKVDEDGRFVLLDLLTIENLRVTIRTWATDFVKDQLIDWVTNKILEALFNWAGNFDIVLDVLVDDEDYYNNLDYKELEIVGIDRNGKRWWIGFHWTSDTWRPHGRPHLQFWREGQKATRWFIDELGDIFR